MPALLPDSRLLREVLIPLKSTSEYGANVHPYTVRRWFKSGVRSPINGLRIKLEAIYQGRTLCTSREAFMRFLRAINAEPVKPRRRRTSKSK